MNHPAVPVPATQGERVLAGREVAGVVEHQSEPPPVAWILAPEDEAVGTGELKVMGRTDVLGATQEWDELPEDSIPL